LAQLASSVPRFSGNPFACLYLRAVVTGIWSKLARICDLCLVKKSSSCPEKRHGWDESNAFNYWRVLLSRPQDVRCSASM